MKVVDRKPVPIYEVKCLECHSIIQYKKSEASLGSINCPVCGIPIWVDILADTFLPVKYEEPENA